jgi:hypothetical protein
MVVLAALVFANLVLLLLLFRPDWARLAQPPGEQVGVAPAPSTLPASNVPTMSPKRSSSEQAKSSVKAAPANRLLLAISADTAWRATVGDCDTPGQVERSTNGGSSWKQIVVRELAPIVRLGAETGGNLSAIGGTGQHCSIRYVTYASDGTVTATRNSSADVWYPTPDDRDEVNAPGGTKARPCKQGVVGLAPLDRFRALAVCTSGAAMSTSDSGKTWGQIARIPSTLAIAAGDGRYWLAGIADNCDGIAVEPLTVKGSKYSTGKSRCVSVNEVAAGEIALDVSGNAIWVWAGSEVHVSTDGGRTWA